jgi:hypothetical protein
MAAKRRPGRRGDRPKVARPIYERFAGDHCLQPGHALCLRIPAADLAVTVVVVWTQRRTVAGGASGYRRQGMPPASRLILSRRFRILTDTAKVDVHACGTVAMLIARQCVPSLTTDPQCGVGGSERPEAASANGELSDGAAHESGFDSVSRPTSRESVILNNVPQMSTAQRAVLQLLCNCD